jgi:hypothetical protein
LTGVVHHFSGKDVAWTSHFSFSYGLTNVLLMFP